MNPLSEYYRALVLARVSAFSAVWENPLQNGENKVNFRAYEIFNISSAHLDEAIFRIVANILGKLLQIRTKKIYK